MARFLHSSMPADDPAKVASVLATLMGGEALPFPPGGPDAWIAWADDGSTEIEVVRRGDVLVNSDEAAEWRPCGEIAHRSEVHFAISVPLAADRIIAISNGAGWPARRCTRGDLFELVEVWVEDAFLIELFDPDQARHFASAVSLPQWRKLLAEGGPD